MLFPSLPFLIFFSVYFLFHCLVPVRFRLGLILLGSTIFYGYWKPSYVWLPFALIAVAHGLVVWMERAKVSSTKSRRMGVGVALLLLPLLYFKYTNFFASLILSALDRAPVKFVEHSLPLGISFVTFTLIAYLVDSYRGVFAAERGPLRVAGSVLFFPHLIAGPIVRPRQLIPQLGRPRSPWAGQFRLGAVFFVWGLAKKVIFADPIAGMVDHVFKGDAALTAWHYLLGIYGFSVQIFCDFSGYSDMAIGIALILGLRLPFNFNQPYTAISIVDFWRRWHITLSTWLRDYLYIPLGGSRQGKAKQHRNLIITMVLGGLWHGANVTFLIWGAIHGLALSINHLCRGRVAVPRWLGRLIVFHIVTLAWVFFRAPNVAVASQVLAGPFVSTWSGWQSFFSQQIYPLVLMGIFAGLHWFDSPAWIRWMAWRCPRALLWTLLVMGLLFSAILGAGSSAEFIYFEF